MTRADYQRGRRHKRTGKPAEKNASDEYLRGYQAAIAAPDSGKRNPSGGRPVSAENVCGTVRGVYRHRDRPHYWGDLKGCPPCYDIYRKWSAKPASVKN